MHATTDFKDKKNGENYLKLLVENINRKCPPAPSISKTSMQTTIVPELPLALIPIPIARLLQFSPSHSFDPCDSVVSSELPAGAGVI
jgi:hypothetical protein